MREGVRSGAATVAEVNVEDCSEIRAEAAEEVRELCDFGDCGAHQEDEDVGGATADKSNRIATVIHVVLDPTTRSIALVNLRATLGKESRVRFARLELRSGVLWCGA